LRKFLSAISAYVNAVPQSLNPELTNGQVEKIKNEYNTDDSYKMYLRKINRYDNKLNTFYGTNAQSVKDTKLELKRLSGQVFGYMGAQLPFNELSNRQPGFLSPLNPNTFNTGFPMSSYQGMMGMYGGAYPITQRIANNVIASSDPHQALTDVKGKYSSGLLEQLYERIKELMKQRTNLDLSPSTQEKIRLALAALKEKEQIIVDEVERVIVARNVLNNSNGRINLLQVDDDQFNSVADRHKDLGNLMNATKKFNVRYGNFVKTLETLYSILEGKISLSAPGQAPVVASSARPLIL